MARKIRIQAIQQSFTAGEVAPEVLGRADTDFYYSAAAKLENVYANPQGHITRREGLEFIDTVSSDARLVSFEFNVEQTYLLVFVAGSFEVYKDGVSQATVSSSPISGLTDAQVQEMRYTQSADTLILVHPDFQPIKITRTSDTAWTATNITLSNIPVHAFSGVTVTEPPNTITLSSTSGRDVTATISPAAFNTGDVGQYIVGKNGGVFFIKTFVSSSQVKGDVRVTFPSVGPIAIGSWEKESGYESVWSSSKGWPVTSVFHQGRLWFGGSKSRPQTIWGSKIGDFFNFDVGGGEADEAIDVTIDSDRVNAIRSLISGRNLQVFTSGGEYYFNTDSISPSSLSLVRATAHGTGEVLPVSLDGATIFIEEAGRAVREFTFNDLEQSYTAEDLSLLASHLVNAPVRMVVRRSTSDSPANYVYIVNGDGTMAVLSFLRSSKLAAWSSFTTDGTFEQAIVVDNEVYVLVKRTLDAGDTYLIEKLNPARFMDASQLQTSGTAKDDWVVNTIFANKVMKLRGDDYILEDVTPDGSGNITSSEEVLSLESGYNFDLNVKTLPIDVNLGGVRLTANYRRLVRADIRLLNSRNIVVKYGDNTYKPMFREFGDDVLDAPVPKFTGWKKVHLNGVDVDPQITITQEEPLEFELLSLIIYVK